MVKLKEAKVSLRLDGNLKQAIDKAAVEDQRTFTSMVEKILTDWAKANGFLKSR